MTDESLSEIRQLRLLLDERTWKLAMILSVDREDDGFARVYECSRRSFIPLGGRRKNPILDTDATEIGKGDIEESHVMGE